MDTFSLYIGSFPYMHAKRSGKRDVSWVLRSCSHIILKELYPIMDVIEVGPLIPSISQNREILWDLAFLPS